MAKVFKNWLNFLLFVKDEAKNSDLITRYFLEEFSKNAVTFYEFLLFLKGELLKQTASSVKHQIGKRYLNVISPLCDKFGLFEEKLILDDICFSITDPKNYEKIDKILHTYKKESGKMIEKIIQTLTDFLKSKNHHCEIKGRYKNIYSIFKKLQKKGEENVLKLNDIFAFRIILHSNSSKQCFEVLNLLHDNFLPITELFKDYITIPKINGYQSLHTGLSKIMDRLDLPVEIQIRTKNMHEFAEKGLAAHWFYSIEKKTKLLSDQEKELLHHYSSISKTNADKVYCFSYIGDLFCLEKDSTVLDFAYNLHSDLGNKAKTALINGKEKPLNYKLQTGDKIQIIKSENLEIKANWLNYVHTHQAIKKISTNLKTLCAVPNSTN